MKKRNKQKSKKSGFFIRKTRKENSFSKMSKPEKKHFLSMDLVERMIRIEQRVSASFNKKISYNQTEYYRSLSSEEKKEFEKYLKKHKRRKYLLFFLLLVPMVLLFCLKADVTGNVIKDTLAETIGENLFVNYLENILALFILVVFVVSLIVLIFNKRKMRRYDSNFKILEDIFLKKGTVKHFD